MDQLLPRKPQDVDRWSDEAERSPATDPSTGPADRWTNETVRDDADYPAPAPDGAVSEDLNADLERDGTVGDRSADPLIHGQAR